MQRKKITTLITETKTMKYRKMISSQLNGLVTAILVTRVSIVITYPHKSCNSKFFIRVLQLDLFEKL